MRTTGKQGFTLIELLIVIAIIGILAAVLIPNLMNARTQAQLRAVQAFSSQVYTAGNAILAEGIALTPGQVATAMDGACGATGTAAVTSVTVGTPFNYGWPATPGGVTGCAVAASNGNLFVTVTTDLSGGGYSRNGGPFTAGAAPALP